MNGETATQYGLAALLGLGLAMAAALVLSGGPEEPGSGLPTATVGQPSGRTVSVADSQVLSQTRPWFRGWNTALNTWFDAFGGERERFLRNYAGLTSRMDVYSLRIRLSSSKLGNPRLRALMRRLGTAYRKQFDAVTDANAAVVAGDREAGRSALLRLERADQEKIRAATALIDTFPELGGDLERVR